MSERLFGIEVDGDRVTIVETRGELAVSSRIIDIGSAKDALTVALRKLPRRNARTVRVSLVSPSTTLRRIDVTAECASSRAAFETAAFAALPVNRDTTSVAGMFFDHELLVGDAVSAGAAVVAPLNSVAMVYAGARRRPVEVVAAPLTLTGFDGVWLGLHHDAAEVTLLSGGRPWAYRQLRAGGLGALAAHLNTAGSDDGPVRLAALLDGYLDDLSGAAELNRYLQMVVAELHQTVEFWRNGGEPVPPQGAVLVYGMGANVPAIGLALEESGYYGEVPRGFSEALTHIPLSDRSQALGAYLAAVTAGRDAPEAVFVDPAALSAATLSRRRNRRLTAVAALAALAAGLGAVFVAPMLDERKAEQSALADLEYEQRQFAAVAAVYHQTEDLRIRSEIVEAARTAEPYWPAVVSLGFGTAPQAAVINAFNATAVGTSVSVVLSAELADDSYRELTGWLSRLRAATGTSQVWSSSFSRKEGKVVFNISFMFDTSAASPDYQPGAILGSEASGVPSPSVGGVPVDPESAAETPPAPPESEASAEGSG